MNNKDKFREYLKNIKYSLEEIDELLKKEDEVDEAFGKHADPIDHDAYDNQGDR